MSSDAAPFIPSDRGQRSIPKGIGRVFGSRAYFRLWLAQCFSSLGDWVGLFAILSIATRVSNGSAAAVSLVMVARVVPGFLLGTVGGIIVDRFDRRKVMVVCDLGRFVLLLSLPFVDNLLGLVLVSFALEIFTLLWGPAQSASLPYLVDQDQLANANSLGLLASYGTFPLGGIAFSALAVAGRWLGGVNPLEALKVNQEVLALWVDGLTFLASAAVVWNLPIPGSSNRNGKRIDWTQTFRELTEGLRYIRSEPLARGVIIGIGGGIIGGGAMIPLGPVFARDVLGSSAQFGILMMSLGMGAAVGVAALQIVQKRIELTQVLGIAAMVCGASIVVAALFDVAAMAALFIAVVGASAGVAYVSGFTILQERVDDEIRGRTFATLYTVVRLCLLLSLTVAPLFAELYSWLAGAVLGSERLAHVAAWRYPLPGVRLALWGGGLTTIAAGFIAYRQVGRVRRSASAPAGDEPSDGAVPTGVDASPPTAADDNRSGSAPGAAAAS